MTRTPVVLAACVVFALSGCWKPQPEKPIELHLKLAKSRIQTGEFLWYRLEMKNVGRKPVRIEDETWCWQSALVDEKPRTQTHVEIIGPDGEKKFPRRLPWGYHGEFKFWTNDFSGGGLCAGKTFIPSAPLKGGETLVATPSKVSEVRSRHSDALDDPGDARALPEIPKGWTPEQIGALKRRWKARVEQSGYLYGDPTFRSTATASGVERPQGYRVLDVYDFDKPGKYRMRMVYTPFTWWHISLEVTQRWLKARGYTIEEFLSGDGWPKETRVFVFESNWVQFEVAQAPFPEHLFTHRKGESAQERERTELLRKLMKNPDQRGKVRMIPDRDPAQDALMPAPKRK